MLAYLRDRMRDQIKGCLVGGAIGDAMGMPVESMTFEEIREATESAGISEFRSTMQWRIKQMANLKAGDTTDDTQMTLAIARSIARLGTYDLTDCALEQVKEFRNSTIGWGRTTQRTMREISDYFEFGDVKGRNPEVPASGEGCGNGVAMKITPPYRSTSPVWGS